jgi:outer membrane protein assembly factor BamD (BamD/ComL family)
MGSLKQKIEESQHQQVASYVEEVKRRAAGEPDVTEQAKILDRALLDHPGQASLREQRELVRQRQAVADATVERARRYEKDGSYRKALDEWKKLESINPRHPSLSKEVERFGRASKHREIEDEIARVRRLFDAGRFSECKEALEHALESAGGDPNLEKYVFRCLTTQAERIVQTDWRAAEAFVHQGTELRGNWQPPPALRGSIAQKREEERQVSSFENYANDEPHHGSQHGTLGPSTGLRTEEGAPSSASTAKWVEDTRERDPQTENTLRQLNSLKALVEDPKNTSFLEDYLVRCRSLAAGHQSQRIKELANSITDEILTFQFAHRALLEGNRTECLAVCDRFLHENPGNALFLALQSEARQARRTSFEQSGTSRVAESSERSPQGDIDSGQAKWQIVRYIKSLPRPRLLIMAAALVAVVLVPLVLPVFWHRGTKVTPPPTVSKSSKPGPPPPDSQPSSPGPPPQTPQDDMGTLVVNSDVDGADIILDGQKYSQKTVKGSIRIPLKVAQHEIEIKRNGYSGNGVVKADIVKGTDTAIVFNLSAQPATLEIRGAAEGTLVQVNGITLGTTAAEGVFSRKIRAGDIRIALSKNGFTLVELRRRTEPGQVVQLSGPSVVLTPISASSEELEARDWDRIEATGSEADWKEFLKKYPNSPNASSAAAKIEQYDWDAVDKNSRGAVEAFLAANPNGANAEKARQTLKSLKENEAKQAEQAAWEAVDKNDKEAVLTFLARYPNQAHSKAAQELVQQIEKNLDDLKRSAAAAEENAWRGLDKRDRNALEEFLKHFPAGNHAEEARKALRALNDE